MNILDLENIAWFSLLFLTGQQISGKDQLHRNDVDTLNWIPRKNPKVDPKKTSKHSPA